MAMPGPKRLADLARLVIHTEDVRFGRWESLDLRGDAAGEGFESDAMPGEIQGSESLVEGDGALASLRGPSAREQVFPIGGRAGTQDLLIGEVAGLPHPGDVLGEDSQVAGHGGIAWEAENLSDSLENSIHNYFVIHKENACIQ
jgi:hypothetical protein